MPLPIIEQSPSAFVPLAQAINTIARALNAASGTGGLRVTVSEGKIIFELAGALDVDITGHAATATEADFAYFADTAAFANVAYDAYAVPASGITGNTLPAGVTGSSLTTLGNLVSLEVVGISNLAAVYCTGLSVNFSSGASIVCSSTGFSVNTGTKSLVISFASITHDMSVREIDVCDSGTPKQMLVLGSAPF